MAGTPAQNGYNEAGYNEAGNNDSSRKTVALASWPSPAAREPGGTPEQALERKRKAKANGSTIGLTPATHLSHAVQLASWATPAVRDFKSESATDAFNEKRWSHPRGKPLSAEATLASWPTPNAANGERGGYSDQEAMARRFANGHQRNLQEVASGSIATGFPAQMEKPGQLSPDHSRWLMGYSAAHLSCAPSGIASSRKRQPRS